MGKLSIGEVKEYLGLDGEEQNKLLSVFLSSAEQLVEKVLREPLPDDIPPIVKTAVLFSTWQFYFHRDNKEFNQADLEKTVALMLSHLRRTEF